MDNRIWIGIAIVVVALAAIGLLAMGNTYAPSNSGTVQQMNMGHNSSKISTIAFHDAMRKLWEDHITWTRLTIVSFAGSQPDFNATVSRLLLNQQDIGNAIKPFYGNAAGDKLAGLLKVHILTAAQVLEAAKSGNSTALSSSLSAWYANANDIADFVSSANPNLSDASMRAMMKTHLDLTLAEAADELTGNYTGSVQEYDNVHAEILNMSDMLSSGIMAQFPQDFYNATLTT